METNKTIDSSEVKTGKEMDESKNAPKSPATITPTVVSTGAQAPKPALTTVKDAPKQDSASPAAGNVKSG